MKKENVSLEKLLDFLALAGKLKKAIRFSANKKMPGDSSADHSWRVALMAFTVARELGLKIDIEKAVKIAIIHDIAEASVGDIDYRLIVKGKVTKKEKYEKERKALGEIKKLLPGEAGNEIYKLWIDFEEGRSREAKFVRALDKLETVLYLVEMKHKTYDMPELIATYPDRAVSDFPELLPMLKAAKQRLKQEFKKGKFPWKKEYDAVVAS